MGLLTKEQLLERRERTIKKVPLPWLDKKEGDDSHVLIQSLKAIEISRWRKSLLDKDGNPDPKQIERQRERLIVMALVDESGTRILDVGDLEALNQQGNSVIDAIFKAIEEQNGTKFDLPNVEDTAGNSKQTAENSQPAE
jgi:hypothetical protein